MKKHWRQYLGCVTASQFLSMTAFSAAYTFMPFYFKQIGVRDDRLSWYVALFAAVGNIGFASAAPIWGTLADRYGRKLMLLRANFAAALLIPAIGFITDPDLVIVHRFFLGALTGTVTASQTLVMGTTPADRRTFALGVLASGLFSGLMLGQFSGGIVAYIGFRWTFFLGGLLLVTAALLVLPIREDLSELKTGSETAAPKRRGNWSDAFRFGKVWYLLILFVAMTIARDMDGAFVPLLVDRILHDRDMALRWSGYIFGSCSAVAIVMGSAIGWIADRTKVLTVLIVTVFLAAVLRLPQICADSVATLLVGRCLMTAAACGIEPLLQSWLAAATPEKEHGRFFGIAGSFKAVGWAFGAIAGGWIIELCGNRIRAVFVASMVLMLLLIPVMKYLASKMPPPERRPRKPRS